MITHYLGRDEVDAYCRDLANRLRKLGPNFPHKWFALGLSGARMAEFLLRKLTPQECDTIEISCLFYDRTLDSINFDDSIDALKSEKAPVLVLDSSVYSGRSMLSVIEGLQQRGVKNIISYSLVLKVGSVFIPSYFGLLIRDKDRIFLPNDVLPNNRLNEAPPFGVLREVAETDIGRKIGKIGPPFDRISVGDLLYDKRARRYHAYVYQCGAKIAAFVSFSHTGNTVFLDALATVAAFRGHHIAGALLRWVETWASSSLCDRIELWAFEPAIPVYEKYGYKFVDNEVHDLGKEIYRVMEKRLSYHVRMKEHGAHAEH